jgi:arylsulfatase A-like enzyme
MKIILYLLFFITIPVFTAEPKPDIVFIVVDDLNDWVGVMDGHPQTKTPNIDALAKLGMLFTNAHCNAPQCGPYRKSFLSGMYPKNTGRYFNSTKRPLFFGKQAMSTTPTKTGIIMHQHFLNNNYRVVSGGKVAHGGPGGAIPKAKLDAKLPLQGTRIPKDKILSDKRNLWGDVGPHGLEEEKTGDYKVAQWAIKQWNTPSQKPLFMTIGFYRPHRPLNIPKKYFDKFPVDKVKLPLVQKDDLSDMPQYAKDLARSHAHKEFHNNKYSDHEKVLKMGGEAEWKYMVSSYLACVNYVDTQIGLLLTALKKNPRNRKTIIVLTSDHGWHLGEKKHYSKGAIWKNTTNVPFIVMAPGFTKGNSNSKQPISHVDIYPTLCELAGLKLPTHLDGKSIVPLMKDPKRKRQYAFLSYGPENTAIQSERYRLIRYEDGSEELYDHQKDPHEWYNLAKLPEYKTLKETLKTSLLDFQRNK